MESPVSSEEVLVCQTCGDEGYTNAFIYCVKCLGFVIHRYCLDVMPKTYDEFVKWFCDDCKSPLPYHFTSPPEYDPSESHKEDPPNTAVVKTTHSKKKRKKKPLKKRKIVSLVVGKDNEFVLRSDGITRRVVLGLEMPKDELLKFQEKVARSSHVKTTKDKKLLETLKKKRKVVPLPGEDKISRSQETPESNCQNFVETPANSPLKEAFINSDIGVNQITPQSAELDNGGCLVEENVERKNDTTCVAVKTKKHKTEKTIEHSSCESSCTDVTSKNEEEITHTEEGLRHECGPDRDKLVSNSSSTEKELKETSKEFNGNAYASQSLNLEYDIEDTDYQLAIPIEDTVWRGSFSIAQTDYDLFEGFVGHLSSKACHKVCVEATTLPSMLSLEMHSRAHLWPLSFLQCMPSGESIGLYFFPEDPKNERDFEQLVSDMIDEDLAMKATSKNAELLIFTSKVLPQSYWRFRGNYYLWGVFRAKKNDVPASNPGDKHGSSANSASKVTGEKEILKRMKTVESHSPQSPLCNYWYLHLLLDLKPYQTSSTPFGLASPLNLTV